VPYIPEGWKSAAPEIGWKDHLIENQVLKNLTAIIGDPSSHRAPLRPVAIRYREAIQEREGNPIWDRAQRQIEESELQRTWLGYMTGLYARPFTDADAALLQLRDDNNRLREMINNHVAAAIFGYDPDMEARHDVWRDHRYESLEGYITNLRGMLGWLDVPRFSPAGELLSVGEYKEARRNLVAQQIEEDVRTEEYWAAKQIELNSYREERRLLPVGATKEDKTALFDAYIAAIGEIENNPYFDIVPKTWRYNVGYKPVVMLRDDFRDLWFHTIRETKPTWMKDEGEKYGDYLLRVAEWQEELPLISEAFGRRFLDSIIERQQEALDERQIEDPAKIVQWLADQTDLEGYDAWVLEKDTILEALDRVWMENYYGPFWEGLEALGDEATSREKEQYGRAYDEANPIPDPQTLLMWVIGRYGPEPWTGDEILEQIEISGVLGREERLEESRINLLGEQVAAVETKMWDMTLRIPVGQMDTFQREFMLAGGDENFISTWYDVQSALAWKDFGDFQRNVEIFEKTLEKMQWPVPSDNELKMQITAQTLNDQFRGFIDRTLGEDLWRVMGYYYELPASQQEAFREDYPEEYARIKKYREERNKFASENPIWAAYYCEHCVDVEEKRISTKTQGAGRAGGAAPLGAAARPRPTDFGTFLPPGMRSTMDARYLLEDGTIGRGGVTQPPWWPDWYLDKVGEQMAKELERLAQEGEPVSEAGKEYLRGRAKRYPEEKPLIEAVLDDKLPDEEDFDPLKPEHKRLVKPRRGKSKN
jgi:hypothetical protein